MRLMSESFENGKRMSEAHAAGIRSASGVGFGPNRNPHLRWSDAPTSTRSFALLCIDPDVPTVKEMVGRDDIAIPVDQLRCDFVHWAMVDIPPDVCEIAAGSSSDGVMPHGKAQPKGPHGSRQGLNDYTSWFASDADMRGDWKGYDGPFPPPNDLRLHKYFFRVFALDVAQLDVPAQFSAGDVFRAMRGHLLAEASLHGTYSLHPDVKG